ncbi:MAG: L-aspartate oxidase [Candidatus Ranarchaeia archaeon]
MTKKEFFQTNYLVIGSGIAGLNFALKAKEFGKVTIVTKKKIMESNTNYAQGGIAAVLGSNDSFKDHLKDTIVAGDGLCNEDAVKILVSEGPNSVMNLIKEGVVFDRFKSNFSLGLEGGHTRNRIIHAGDYTGREIEKKLVSAIRRNKIRVLEYHIAYELFVENGICRGARILDINGNKIIDISANVIILTTGGIGQVFKHNTNPKIATGDGIAMGYLAGAEIADMEFVQFHPTTLNVPSSRNFLISEALRGEGAILVNKDGKRFMENIHPLKELAPRDIVTRAMFHELKNGPVYLDIRHKGKEFIKNRFPMIYKTCLKHKIDITKQKFEVVPAAHYLCGGVKTDINGETIIKRLYAFGETANTGVHGANRLASNSLLESIVFGNRSFNDSKKYEKIPIFTSEKSHKIIQKKWKESSSIKSRIQDIMWEKAGIIRKNIEIEDGIVEIQSILKVIRNRYTDCISKDVIEVYNLSLIALLILKSALIRKESRGAHFNLDYPKKDDKNWRKHIIIRKGDENQIIG